jgi:hypothetical protein
METKLLEIRDSATFVPVMATLLLTTASPGSEERQAEYYLLRRTGFGFAPPSVMLCRLDANGGNHQASYDEYGWGMARTMGAAHLFIREHWTRLKSGDVIDVEYILGETKVPKQSERFGDLPGKKEILSGPSQADQG